MLRGAADVHGLAGLILLHHEIVRQPAVGVVLAPEPVLDGAHAASDRLVELLHESLCVVGMNSGEQLFIGELAQFPGAEAQDLLDHRADIVVAVVPQVAPIRHVERVLQHGAEPLLALLQGLFRELAPADIPHERFDPLEPAAPENGGGDNLDGKDMSILVDRFQFDIPDDLALGTAAKQGLGVLGRRRRDVVAKVSPDGNR